MSDNTPKVRAKFRLDQIHLHNHSRYLGGDKYEQIEARTLIFNAVTSGSEENKRFFASTPTGQLKMDLLPPEVWRQFELGKEYYLDFSAAFAPA